MIHGGGWEDDRQNAHAVARAGGSYQLCAPPDWLNPSVVAYPCPSMTYIRYLGRYYYLVLLGMNKDGYSVAVLPLRQSPSGCMLSTRSVGLTAGG